MKLALCGPSLAGKTSLACCLSQRSDFYLLNYTDVLKRIVRRMLNDAGKDITLEEMQQPEMKERLRKLYIATGEALGFMRDGWGIDRMIVEMEAQEKHGRTNFVFDNVRSERQWELLKDHGFILVRIDVGLEEQLDRALERRMSRKEVFANNRDVSEQYDAFDILLDGTRPVEDNANIILRLAGLPTIRPAQDTKPLRPAA